MALVYSVTPPVVTIAKVNKDHYQVRLSSAQTDDPSNTNLDHARKKQAGARPFPGIWTLHFIGWVARMMTWEYSYLTLGSSALFCLLDFTSSAALTGGARGARVGRGGQAPVQGHRHWGDSAQVSKIILALSSCCEYL